MWIQTEQEKGKISVTYRVADKGAISLVAASSDGKAPKLTLEWDRPVENTYARPLIVVGVLVLLIGILLFIVDAQVRRREAQRKDARDRRIDRRANRAAAETTVLTKIEAPDVDESTTSIEPDATSNGPGDAVVADEVTPHASDTSGPADSSPHKDPEKQSSGDETEGNADDEENTHA